VLLVGVVDAVRLHELPDTTPCDYAQQRHKQPTQPSPDKEHAPLTVGTGGYNGQIHSLILLLLHLVHLALPSNPAPVAVASTRRSLMVASSSSQDNNPTNDNHKTDDKANANANEASTKLWRVAFRWPSGDRWCWKKLGGSDS